MSTDFRPDLTQLLHKITHQNQAEGKELIILTDEGSHMMKDSVVRLHIVMYGFEMSEYLKKKEYGA